MSSFEYMNYHDAALFWMRNNKKVFYSRNGSWVHIFTTKDNRSVIQDIMKKCNTPHVYDMDVCVKMIVRPTKKLLDNLIDLYNMTNLKADFNDEI